MVKIEELERGKIFYMCNEYHYICKCEFIAMQKNAVRYKDVTEGSLTRGMVKGIRSAFLTSCFLNEDDAVKYQNECKEKIRNMKPEELLRKFYNQLSSFELISDEEKTLYNEALQNIETGIDTKVAKEEIENAKSEANRAIIKLAAALAEVEELKEQKGVVGVSDPVLKSKTEKLEKEKSDLLTQKRDLTNKIKELETKLSNTSVSEKDFKSEKQRFEMEKRALEENFNKVKADKDKFESGLLRSQLDVKRFREDLEKIKKEKEEWESAKKLFENNKLNYEKVKTEIEKKYNLLLKENEKLKADLENSADTQKLETKLFEKENEISDLKTRIFELENVEQSDIEEKSKTLENELSVSKREIQSIRQQARNKDEEIENLKAQLQNTPSGGPAPDKMDVIKLIGNIQSLYEDAMTIYAVYNGNMAITNLYLNDEGEEISDPIQFYGQPVVDSFWNKWIEYKGSLDDFKALNKLYKELEK